VQVGVAISVVGALLCLAGCGGSGDGVPPQVVTQILSDPRFDGDIEQTSSTSYTITQGMSPIVQSVLAGWKRIQGFPGLSTEWLWRSAWECGHTTTKSLYRTHD
jgi:hypothetical protein